MGGQRVSIRRFLQVGLISLLLFSVGILAYTQIRPSADTVGLVGDLVSADCPQTTFGEMPSHSISRENSWEQGPVSFGGGYEAAGRSVSQIGAGPGFYNLYQYTEYGDSVSISTGAFIPAHSTGQRHAIIGPATVVPGQYYTVTYSQEDLRSSYPSPAWSVTAEFLVDPSAQPGTIIELNWGFRTGQVNRVIGKDPTEYFEQMRYAIANDRSPTNGAIYIVGPSSPRNFVVELTQDRPAFVGKEQPTAQFSAKSSLKATANYVLPEGFGATPSPVTLTNEAQPLTVNGPLKPGLIPLKITATEACGGTAEVSAMGMAYDLKLFTENPAIDVSLAHPEQGETSEKLKITELSIGLNGWTQLQTDQQRTDFKDYFADKKWKLTLLARSNPEDPYGFVPETQFGIKGQTSLTTADGSGVATLPIRVGEWTPEAASQVIQIRPPKAGLGKDFKLKLEIDDTDSVREFKLGVAARVDLSFYADQVPSPTDAVNPKDEDQIADSGLADKATDDSLDEAADSVGQSSAAPQSRLDVFSLERARAEETQNPVPDPTSSSTPSPGQAPLPVYSTVGIDRIYGRKPFGIMVGFDAKPGVHDYIITLLYPSEDASFIFHDKYKEALETAPYPDNVTVRLVDGEVFTTDGEGQGDPLRRGERIRVTVGNATDEDVAVSIPIVHEDVIPEGDGFDLTFSTKVELVKDDNSFELLDDDRRKLKQWPYQVSRLDIVSVANREFGSSNYKTKLYNPEKPDDTKLFPSDIMSYKGRVDLPESLRDAGVQELSPYSVVAQLSDDAELYGEVPADATYNEDKRELRWRLSDVVTDDGFGLVFFQQKLNEEIPGHHWSVGARFYVEDTEQREIVSGDYQSVDKKTQTLLNAGPSLAKHKVWVRFTGTATTYAGKPFPYVTIAASQKAMSQEHNDEAKEFVPAEYHDINYESRLHSLRTRTLADGTYVLDVPRVDLDHRSNEKLSDAMRAANPDEKYHTYIRLEYMNDEYEYDYRYSPLNDYQNNYAQDILDSDGTVNENKQFIPSPVIASALDFSPKRAVVDNKNFDLRVISDGSRADMPSIMGNYVLGGIKALSADPTLFNRVQVGSEVLRELFQVKHYAEEEIKAHLGYVHAGNLLGPYQVLALSTDELTVKACNTKEGSGLICSNKFVAKYGPEYTKPDLWNSSPATARGRQIVFHEWTHHFHNYIHTDYGSIAETQLAPNSDTRELPKVPSGVANDFNVHKLKNQGGIEANHFGTLNDRTDSSVSEGFADFMGVYFDRMFNNRSDWKLEGRDGWAYNIALPMPIFAGLANGYNQVGTRSAAPVVFANEGEEYSVKTFLKFAIDNQTTYTASGAWWAGLASDGAWSAPGTESTRLAAILQALGEAEDYPSLVRKYLAFTNITDPETRSRVFRLFGLFGDANCNWTYDALLDEEVGVSGTYCPFVPKGANYQGKYDSGDRSAIVNMIPFGPRPWRDQAKPLNRTSMINWPGERDRLSAGPGRSAPAYVHVVTDSPGEQMISVKYEIPDVYDQPPITITVPVTGEADIPLTMYPPIVRTRVTIQAAHSSSSPLILASEDYISAAISETGTGMVASKSFVIDDGVPPVVDTTPFEISPADEPLAIGECRLVDDEPIECAVERPVGSGQVVLIPGSELGGPELTPDPTPTPTPTVSDTPTESATPEPTPSPSPTLEPPVVDCPAGCGELPTPEPDPDPSPSVTESPALDLTQLVAQLIPDVSRPATSQLTVRYVDASANTPQVRAEQVYDIADELEIPFAFTTTLPSEYLVVTETYSDRIFWMTADRYAVLLAQAAQGEVIARQLAVFPYTGQTVSLDEIYATLGLTEPAVEPPPTFDCVENCGILPDDEPTPDPTTTPTPTQTSSLPPYDREASHYHAQAASQSANPTLAIGTTTTFEFRLTNTGSATWYRGVVRLGSDRPTDRVSILDPGAGWERCNRVELVEESVAPGEIGTFRFEITATTLTQPGTYREYFRGVVDGVTWLEDLGLYFDVTITPATTTTTVKPLPVYDKQASHYQASLISQSANPILAHQESATLEVKLRNTGSATWQQGVLRLGSDQPADRVSVFDPGVGWERCNRVELVEPSVAPGAIGTFRFDVTATTLTPAGVYSEHFRPVVDGVAWFNDLVVNWDIRITEN